jgi:hypothetical protein
MGRGGVRPNTGPGRTKKTAIPEDAEVISEILDFRRYWLKYINEEKTRNTIKELCETGKQTAASTIATILTKCVPTIVDAGGDGTQRDVNVFLGNRLGIPLGNEKTDDEAEGGTES